MVTPLTSKRRSYATITPRSGPWGPSPASYMCTTAWCAACWRKPACPGSAPPPRPSQIDPYLPLIRETLETFPTLTASRLFAMAYERGYRGSPDHFRHLIALHRPRRPAEAYLRLRSLPGEQAQVDWALCRARHRAHYAEDRTMPSN